MPEPIRLLVVDDAVEHAQMVVEFLRSSEAWPNAEMKVAASYEEALQALPGRPSTSRSSTTDSARGTG